MYLENNIYKFSFLPTNTIIHGISTKHFGVLKKRTRVHTNNLKKFLKELGITYDRTVLAGLVHGKNVAIVTDTVPHRIENTDGLITKKKNIFLWIGTADCLPLIFYDPNKKIVGIAHAGYKGILSGIVEEMVQKCKKLGSKTNDIQIGIGPGIGVCCYNVSKERIGEFKDKFGKGTVYEERDEKLYLDLEKTVIRILVKEGILEKNIEHVGICTKDHQDLFYSHRGTGNRLHDDFVTIVGMI